jgi:hypothetical protein
VTVAQDVSSLNTRNYYPKPLLTCRSALVHILIIVYSSPWCCLIAYLHCQSQLSFRRIDPVIHLLSINYLSRATLQKSTSEWLVVSSMSAVPLLISLNQRDLYCLPSNPAKILLKSSCRVDISIVSLTSQDFSLLFYFSIYFRVWTLIYI